MSQVKEAYAPPTSEPRSRRVWVKLALFSILIGLGLSVLAYSAIQARQQAERVYWESNRGPVPLNPNAHEVDGSGKEVADTVVAGTEVAVP